VLAYNVEILDNSTYGYPDAVSEEAVISAQSGAWSSIAKGVLGTFANAGNFQGAGTKYLAFRFLASEGYKYGWVRLSCSQHNDRLQIVDYAYNFNVNQEIIAHPTIVESE
jgi:hypothetical protein